MGATLAQATKQGHRTFDNAAMMWPVALMEDYLQQHLEFQDDSIVVEADGSQVMMRWEVPLMRRMAEIATMRRGRVLEIGFGMGLSCDAVQALGPQGHVIVEAHPQIVERARVWSEQRTNVQIIDGRWQDQRASIDDAGPFDGISFDVFGGAQQQVEFFSHLGTWLKPRGLATLWIGDAQQLPEPVAETLTKQGFQWHMDRVTAIPDRRCTYSHTNEFRIPIIYRK